MPILYREHQHAGEGQEVSSEKHRRKKGGALGRLGRAVKKQFKHGSGDKGDEKKQQQEHKRKDKGYGLSLNAPPVPSKSRDKVREASERARQLRRVERAHQLLRQQQAHPVAASGSTHNAPPSMEQHYKELASRVASVSNKGYVPNDISSDEFRPIKKTSPITRHPHGITMVSAHRTIVGTLNNAGRTTIQSAVEERQDRMMYQQPSSGQQGDCGYRRHSRRDSYRRRHDTEDASSSMPEEDEDEPYTGEYDAHSQSTTSIDRQSSIASSGVTGNGSVETEESSQLPVLPHPGVTSRPALSARESMSDSGRRKKSHSRIGDQEACSLPSDLDAAAAVVVIPSAGKSYTSTTSLVTQSLDVEYSDSCCQTDAYLWDDCLDQDEEDKDESMGSVTSAALRVVTRILTTLKDICLCQSKLNKRTKTD